MTLEPAKRLEGPLDQVVPGVIQIPSALLGKGVILSAPRYDWETGTGIIDSSSAWIVYPALDAHPEISMNPRP